MGWRSRISKLTIRRIFLGVIALFLMLLARALFTMPLPLACRILAKLFKGRSLKDVADITLHSDIAWAVELASRKVRGSRCLDRALVAKAILSMFRRDSKLRVGMAAASSGSISGHAWIEAAGGIVVGGSEAELERYKVLPQEMTIEQQIIFFLAMQRNSGANARNRALEQVLDTQ